MAEKVKLSKDGNSIDFIQAESLPTSVKKFRQSLEIQGFYRFIFENDLQKEAFEILERIINLRKAKKKTEKVEAAAVAQAAKKADINAKSELAKKAIQEKISTPAAKSVVAVKVAPSAKSSKPATKKAASSKPASPKKAPKAAKPIAKKSIPAKKKLAPKPAKKR